MAKKKNNNYTIGNKNAMIVSIGKPLIKLIISIQNEENNKIKKKKGRKASFVWASVELTKRLKNG